MRRAHPLVLFALTLASATPAAAYVVSWDSHVARQIERLSAPEVRACYEQELDAGLEWEGSVDFRVRIGPDGTIHDVRQRARPNQERRAFTWCMRDAIRAVRVDPPPRGHRGEVRFTLLFRRGAWPRGR